MSCKSLVCAGLLCGLLVAPVAAQPSVTVDLLRHTAGPLNGRPMLSAAGNWQWAIMVTPDAFSSAVSVELGVEVMTNGVAGITSAALGDAIWDTSNPGSSIFGWETTDGSDDDGLQVNGAAGQAVLFVGSNVFAAASGPSLLATIEAGRPDAPNAATATTTSIEIMGAYMGDGITVGGGNAIVAQQTASGPDVISTVAFTANDSASVRSGDANMDGSVNFTDVGQFVSPNFGQPAPRNWQQGDFDGNDMVNFTDIGQFLSPNFGQSFPPAPGGGSAVVPEPTGALLAMLGLLLAGLSRTRR